MIAVIRLNPISYTSINCIRCEGQGFQNTWRASDFEIRLVAVLAANRIDRKNEIDAVPAISPYIRLGVILSTRC